MPVPVFTGPDGDCWVKSAAMVAAYYHNDTYDRSSYLKTLVPQSEWGLVQGIIDAIKWGTTDIYHDPAINPKLTSTMSPATICNYLNNDAPIVARITTGGIGFHAVVLKAYTDYDGNVKYNDPYYGEIVASYSKSFYPKWQDSIVPYLL
ncbi:papain-like cysteine protease family protein [Caldanaerobius fijiensis]|uniref:papain-like cysteine protease family protein n=1 Tax=Caldanaerobius fijiensis TaxID=456330 RepID=UPI0009353037|nr:papain-like cysteine protease family protein [Caldanaerobius fijiensis]